MFGRGKSGDVNGKGGGPQRDLLSVGEELPGLASELTEVLRMDWRRSTGDQESKDRLQSVCFRYGQRLGELNISADRALARMESEVDSLRDESVRTSHSRLASLGARSWNLLHHELPSLMDRQDRLEDELMTLQDDEKELRRERPFYWHRLVFFIVPAIALLAAELAMGEEITRTALRLTGKLWWLFMAALLALPLIFKQIFEWDKQDRIARRYLVTLVALVVVALFPLAYLRSEQAMRYVLRTRGSAGAAVDNPFAGPIAGALTPGTLPALNAGGSGVAQVDPFAPQAPTSPQLDPFAPLVGGGTDDPFSPQGGTEEPFSPLAAAGGTASPQASRTEGARDAAREPAAEAGTTASGQERSRNAWSLTLTFLLLGLVFPMLSGLAFAKGLEQADMRHEGQRLRRRKEGSQKDLAAAQASLKSCQAELASHQAEIVTLVEGLGDSREFADKVIAELISVLRQLDDDLFTDLLSRIEQLRDLDLKEMSKRLNREVGMLKLHGDMMLATQIKHYTNLIGEIAQIDGGNSLEKLAQSRTSTLRTTLLDGYEAGRAAAFALLRSYKPEEKLDMVENRDFHRAFFRDNSGGSGSGSALGGEL